MFVVPPLRQQFEDRRKSDDLHLSSLSVAFANLITYHRSWGCPSSPADFCSIAGNFRRGKQDDERTFTLAHDLRSRVKIGEITEPCPAPPFLDERDDPVRQHARLQPFLDQADDARIAPDARQGAGYRGEPAAPAT
jgi:hypothetical protein